MPAPSLKQGHTAGLGHISFSPKMTLFPGTTSPSSQSPKLSSTSWHPLPKRD
eukprot:CCRYP_007355-RC/>CCRYP_007355-RC protein AED:0.48 eAED:0.48 QI:0/-1/0/1/-1/0/1/0/51